MAKKKSGTKASTIAGRVLRVLQALPNTESYTCFAGGESFTMADVKTLAASVLSQDETKGQKLPKKRRGRAKRKASR